MIVLTGMEIDRLLSYEMIRFSVKNSEEVQTAKSPEQRKLHKAFLRWHDPKNWPLLRKAIADMGRQELIGDGPNQLIPHYQKGEGDLVYEAHRRKNKGGEHQKRTGKAATNKAGGKPQPGKKMLTQHTGLPPKAQANAGEKRKPTGKPKKDRK